MMNAYKLLMVLALFWMNIGFAQQNKIVLINTDTTLKRYVQMATEFKNVVIKENYQVIDLNIKDFTDAEAEVELARIIQTENPSFIYCIGSKAYQLAKDRTKDIPLLFSGAINWPRLGINDKTYGVANELLPEQELMILRDTFPSIKKIGLLYNEEMNHEYVESVKHSAAAVNIQIINQTIGRMMSKEDFDATLDELMAKVDMFWMITDPVVLENKAFIDQIFVTAKKQKKPVYTYSSDAYLKYGPVLIAAADNKTIGRQVAALVSLLQSNKNPPEHVQPPLSSEITLNLCAVEKLGLPLNKYALDSVNKIVNCKDIK